MGDLDLDSWLYQVENNLTPKERETIRQAISLAKIAHENIPKMATESLMTAKTLNSLGLDSTTLAAAILYSTIKRSNLTLTDIKEHLDEQTIKLIHGAEQMSGIGDIYHNISNNPNYQNNINNIRKMFLAMVDDIRVVLIKLSEHLATLRSASIFPDQIKKQLAAETMAIYAPLTNRLGIAQIKWELEDLAFQYLEPTKYSEIDRSLREQFPEATKYIDEVSESLEAILQKASIKNLRISGRTKHVYSIYRKMNRKKIGLDGIYDISAMRIFVPTITDCYKALSAIHTKWEYIPHEFDDYIAAPKPNGYRSIHTAIFGPKERIVEIQIRTFDMHREAELGIAAHWVYKEGKQEANYQAKLAWLREVIDWQQEINLEQIFSEYVYVFTPGGDIFELPQGSTPLDFAYHLHSELGHHCIGAKINGKLSPLTSVLKIGDRIEILTARNSQPSRDWLIPSLGFLKTLRSRTKVLHWFKKHSKEHNIIQGQEYLDKELKKLHLNKIDLKKAASKLSFKTSNDLLAALGSGDIKLSTILNALDIELEKKDRKAPSEIIPSKIAKEFYSSDINIEGVNNLLIHTANCCRPIPGEKIIGYITLGRGIAIHRLDCTNVFHSSKIHPERFISATWREETKQNYPADIYINAFDRQNLLRDIKNLLAEEEIRIIKLDTITNKKPQKVKIKLTIEISNANSLSSVLNKLKNLPSIIEIYRGD